jgi:chemotaxis-related protein WspB
MLFSRFAQKTQYLQLQAGDVLCCLSLSQVQKLLSLMALTPVTDTPPYLAGVFNYHGSTVPVIDLSLRLGQAPAVNYTCNTMVAICKTLENDALLGLIVSAVGNVIELSRDDLQLAPQFTGKAPPFSAVYQQQQACCFVLNVDALLNSSLTDLQSVSPAEINRLINA